MNCHFAIVDGVGFLLWLVKAEPKLQQLLEKWAFACLMATVPCSQPSPTPATSQHQGQQSAAIQELIARKEDQNQFFSKSFECVSKLVNFAPWWNYRRGHGCDPAYSSASDGCSSSVAAFEAPEKKGCSSQAIKWRKIRHLYPLPRETLFNFLPQVWYTSQTCYRCVLAAEGKHVRQMGRSNTARGSVMRLHVYSY